jgi:NADH-quinone oxidoreductase subunit D
LPEEKIPDGHDLIKQPVKLPECEVYCRNELPKGEGAFYLVSTGEKPESRLATEGGRRPYRLKIKSPAFVNLWFLDPLTRGHHIADIIPINSSLDLIFGEVDR